MQLEKRNGLYFTGSNLIPIEVHHWFFIKALKENSMKHKFNGPNRPYAIVDKTGYLQLYTDKGELIKGNLSLRVSDSFEDPPYAIAKFKVNIVGTLEDMQEEIKAFEGLS